jgi:hypothetical protein
MSTRSPSTGKPRGVTLGPTKSSQGTMYDTNRVIENREKKGPNGQRYFKGSVPVIVNSSEEEGDVNPDALHLSKEEMDKLTEKNQDWVTNWLDKSSFDNLNTGANTNNPNSGPYKRGSRVNMASLANQNPDMVLTERDIELNKTSEYMVSICSTAGKCVVAVVTGAFILKKLGILSGGRKTRRNKCKSKSKSNKINRNGKGKSVKRRR